MAGDAPVTPHQESLQKDPYRRDPYQPTTAVEAAARGAAGLRGAPTPSEVIAGLRATSNAEDLIQLLSPEGTFTQPVPPGVDVQRVVCDDATDSGGSAGELHR